MRLQRKFKVLEYTRKTQLNEFLVEFEKLMQKIKKCKRKNRKNNTTSTMSESYQSVVTAFDVFF